MQLLHCHRGEFFSYSYSTILLFVIRSTIITTDFHSVRSKGINEKLFQVQLGRISDLFYQAVVKCKIALLYYEVQTNTKVIHEI